MLDWEEHERKGHEHFMLKEIYEQPEVINSTVDFLKQISPSVWDYMGITMIMQKSQEYSVFWLWVFMACCVHWQIFL